MKRSRFAGPAKSLTKGSIAGYREGLPQLALKLFEKVAHSLEPADPSLSRVATKDAAELTNFLQSLDTPLSIVHPESRKLVERET